MLAATLRRTNPADMSNSTSGATDPGKRTVLVTGATGGIGAETCRALAAAGWRVIVTDLAARATQASELGAAIGNDAAFQPLDVTLPDSCAEVQAHMRAQYGRLDGLVNNAGIILRRTLTATTLAEWRRVQAINVDGVFFGMQTFAPLLAETGAHSTWGSAIVNLSSIYGIGGQPLFAAYCASKGAVRTLTKAAALEFAQLGQRIRVNSVHPGPIDTPLARGPIQEMLAEGANITTDIVLAGVAAQYPGKRIGVPADVAPRHRVPAVRRRAVSQWRGVAGGRRPDREGAMTTRSRSHE